MSETDVVEEKAAKAEAAAEPKEEKKSPFKKMTVANASVEISAGNNRNKGRGGNNRGRHNKQQDPNMNEDDLPRGGHSL
jgi:hypothetical protein